MQVASEDRLLPDDGNPPAAVRAIRTVIIGEVRLYREGLAQLLDGAPFINVVGTPGQRAEAIDATGNLQPDVVLLDATMAGSLGLAREINQQWPDVRVIVFAIPEVEEDVIACAEAGVAGYVSRSASAEELVDTVRSVARGELRCPPRIAATLFHHIGELAAKSRRDPAPAHLTAREREIVAMLDNGLSNKEIARRLRIRTATVKNHVHNILEKLQVSRRGEAAARMRRAAAAQLITPRS
jgi:two-component system, NarL family, nitrate/nitrite response regulator NarL